jgi:hypothetical protein
MLGLSSKRILVVESDGLAVRAADVAARSRGRVRVRGPWESTQPQFDAALDGALARMHSDGVRPATDAVLVVPQLRAMVLPLPVDPAKRLPWAQMQELLRWELEPYLAEARVLRIGAILAARGYVSPDELAPVAASLPAAGTPDARSARPRRFGEVAIDAGLISPEQLDEALAIQDTLQEGEGELVCGWTPLATQPTGGNWDWLVCGIARSLRDRYTRTFRDRGLRLQSLYPLAGCAPAALAATNGSAQGVLEYQPGVLSHTRVEAGRIAAARTRYVTDPDRVSDDAVELAGDDDAPVALAGPWPEPARTADTLEAALARPCEPARIAATDVGEDAHSLAGFVGAARHWLGLVRSTNGVRVQARDPRQPITQHPAFWPAMAACLVALAWAGGELAIARRLDSLRSRSGFAQQFKVERETLDALDDRWTELHHRRAFLADDLARREAFVPRLLDALRGAVSDAVALSRLYEDERGVIHVHGEGASERAIQVFSLRIAEAMRPAGMDVRNLRIETATGASARPTYSFDFEIAESAAEGENR